MFGIVHVIVFGFSLLLWLLMAAWNTRATSLSMGYAAMGWLGCSAYVAYVISAFSLGHLGDRHGFKRPLALSFLAMAGVLSLGFVWKAPWHLFVTAALVMVFYGFFYPSVEGLLSRMEAREGVHPYATTARFSLCWSSGNVLGMALGPWLIERMPEAIFVAGMVFSIAGSLALWLHARRHGERLPSSRPGRPDPNPPRFAGSRLASLRIGARVALVCGSFAFVGPLVLYPKLLSDAGLSLEKVGFVGAFGNLAVFLTFLVLLPTRFWIGRPRLCAGITGAILLVYGAVLFLARSPAGFAAAAALGGCGYAVPYTFALFYGLNTSDADNAHQGSIHEILVGLSQGAGPLAAGLVLSSGAAPGVLGIAILGIALASMFMQMATARFARESRGP